mmetsp:Transcript_16668/g.39207  ORF Transcript_16668/g.39207 Transcript_16668/m.39207 type:complete len:203 (-) Transcript_16668:1295-1903(-)
MQPRFFTCSFFACLNIVWIISCIRENRNCRFSSDSRSITFCIGESNLRPTSIFARVQKVATPQSTVTVSWQGVPRSTDASPKISPGPRRAMGMSTPWLLRGWLKFEPSSTSVSWEYCCWRCLRGWVLTRLVTRTRPLVSSQRFCACSPSLQTTLPCVRLTVAIRGRKAASWSPGQDMKQETVRMKVTSSCLFSSNIFFSTLS